MFDYRKKVSLVMLVLLIIIFNGLTGLAADFPVIIIDDLGDKVVVAEEPARIISLAPSLTEMLFFLGLGDKVVGVTSFADYPEEAVHKEKIGTITDPNLEKIVTLQPDLIIAASINKKETVQQLKRIGLTVAGFDPITVDDIFLSLKKLGKITGQNQIASQLITDMYFTIDRIKELVDQKVAEEGRPKVFYEIWSDPLYTAGANNFIDDVITLAGGDNIGRKAKGAWPQYSLEKLLLENPDVYVSSPHSATHLVTVDEVKNRTNYAQLKAVKNNRIYIIDPNIINRPSPRIVLGLKEFVQAIFPELTPQVEGL